MGMSLLTSRASDSPPGVVLCISNCTYKILMVLNVDNRLAFFFGNLQYSRAFWILLCVSLSAHFPGSLATLSDYVMEYFDMEYIE